MRYVAVAFAVAVILATGAAAVQPGTSQVRIIGKVVFEERTQITYTLLNPSLSPYSIGRAVLICINIGGGPFPSTAKRCNGTYQLAHGTIEVQGVMSSRSFYSLSVIGGTGLYANAGAGELTALTINLNPRRERLTFILYAP
jgi:hypothetical protein